MNAINVWYPKRKTDVDKLERVTHVQKRATKLIPGLSKKSYCIFFVFCTLYIVYCIVLPFLRNKVHIYKECAPQAREICAAVQHSLTCGAPLAEQAEQ